MLAGKGLMRMWLVKETGEVRQVKEGEWYYSMGCHHLKWFLQAPTLEPYPILTVTEITNDRDVILEAVRQLLDKLKGGDDGGK